MPQSSPSFFPKAPRQTPATTTAGLPSTTPHLSVTQPLPFCFLTLSPQPKANT
ncbi:hypothetical protein K440DRAFT_624421 [Wilcoxina mikolae CBS 423.85]|nr:hypothetical protein K440DRAFT_624421 [Wilcoxina mikolae CBS 423.85]